MNNFYVKKKMIITKTPLRISLAGGGTDIPHIYRALGGGEVISTTIDKYIYVIVKKRFDDQIRLGYSKAEIVDTVDQIQHDLIRESMRKVGITKGVEIVTIADIPSKGSGLGSSSSVTVGILNALYLYANTPQGKETLAQQACDIEINILRRPIGKQDQYAAAMGGMNIIKFLSDDTVVVEPLFLSEFARRKLNSNLLLFYTGITREAGAILAKAKAEFADKIAFYRKMKNLVEDVKSCLQDENIDELGPILHQGWILKKQMAKDVTNDGIDELYQRARKAGATGGKITGAGGGGFLMVYCPDGKQQDVRNALKNLHQLPFELENGGTQQLKIL